MTQFINARFEMFKSQNLENGHFDLKFEVEGKAIYAHKFMLATVSEVFKAMLSDTWNNSDSIKIETNSYNHFFEFLTFIYSGECKIDDENIFEMVNFSELYNIESLHRKCDEYLSQKEYTSENVLMFFEKLLNFSLPMFEKTISTSLKEKRINLVESEGFLELSKEMIKKIISFEDRFVSEERLFEKVYEWSENRAIKRQDELNAGNLNLNDAIKAEISEFLPYIHFKKMNFKFLHKFVVKRGFLFTYDELSDILDNAKPDIKIKVTDANGNSIYGMITSDSDVIENLKALKSSPCVPCPPKYVYWETKFTTPSTPSQLMKRDGVEWYLVHLYNGRICVMRHSHIHYSHYLIAEMTTEVSGFECTRNCKIEIE